MRRVASVLTACALGLAGCTEPYTDCEGVGQDGEVHVVIEPRVDPPGGKQVLYLGDTLSLTAEVRRVEVVWWEWGTGRCRTEYGSPIAAAIEWASSDERIASVSATGAVVGRDTGEATITATAPSRRASQTREILVQTRN